MTKSKTAKIDILVLLLIGLMLTYSAAIFLSAYLSGTDMGAWVWERHQNLFPGIHVPCLSSPPLIMRIRGRSGMCSVSCCCSRPACSGLPLQLRRIRRSGTIR